MCILLEFIANSRVININLKKLLLESLAIYFAVSTDDITGAVTPISDIVLPPNSDEHAYCKFS